jgi:hypothetical protein
MNDPLRYAGDTIFQSGFMPGDKTTILLVVSNPGWLVPYVACVVGAVGMLIHFGIMLSTFLRRQAEQGKLSFVRTEPVAIVQPPAGKKKSKKNGNVDDGRSYSLEPQPRLLRRWAFLLAPAAAPVAAPGCAHPVSRLVARRHLCRVPCDSSALQAFRRPGHRAVRAHPGEF